MEDHEFPPLEGGTGDFEKRVHQKMADMELVPSDAVWQKVDQRLYGQTKRRRWLVWLMFLLAGFGLGGYLFWNSIAFLNNKNAPLITKGETLNTKTEKALLPTSKKATPKPSIHGKAQNDTTEKSLTPKKENHIASSKYKIDFLKGKSLKPDSGSAVQTNKNSLNSKSTVLSVEGVSKTILPPFKKNGKTVSDELNEEENQAASVLRSNVEKHEAKIPGTVTGVTYPGSEPEPAAIKNLQPSLVRPLEIPAREINTSLVLRNVFASATMSKIKLKQAHNLSWGLIMVGGRSAANSGSLHSLFQNSSALDAQNALPIGNINLPPVPVPVPSVIKAGPAFKFGIFLKRQMTSRLSMSVGLNYSLFTLSNNVGEKVDSAITISSAFAANKKAIDGYFKTGNSQKYISMFHFIELPVLLHAKLSAKEKIPLSLDLGFSVSRLVSSNALHYNSSSGIYYRDNNLFNKTQVSLITALPIRIYSANKFSLDAGPHIQYGITKLLSDQNTGNKHFFFLGIKAGILLKRNK